MNFGEKFTALVEESGETYEKIAAALGLKSRSSIIYYMKCISLPKHELVMKICEHFDVMLDYFTDKTMLRQPTADYHTEKRTIPVLSGESQDAVKVGEVSVPYLNIDDGFAIVVDDRLEKLGFQQGSTLFLSKKADVTSSCKIIAQQGTERFFATYEKRGRHAVILPLDKEKPPVSPEENGTTVFAVLKHILIEV